MIRRKNVLLKLLIIESCDDSVDYSVSLTDAPLKILRNEKVNRSLLFVLICTTAVPSFALPFQIKWSQDFCVVRSFKQPSKMFAVNLRPFV